MPALELEVMCKLLKMVLHLDVVKARELPFRFELKDKLGKQLALDLYPI